MCVYKLWRWDKGDLEDLQDTSRQEANSTLEHISLQERIVLERLSTDCGQIWINGHKVYWWDKRWFTQPATKHHFWKRFQRDGKRDGITKLSFKTKFFLHAKKNILAVTYQTSAISQWKSGLFICAVLHSGQIMFSGFVIIQIKCLQTLNASVARQGLSINLTVRCQVQH